LIAGISWGEKGGRTFGIAPKVPKGLAPKPPKAEKPGGLPKTRKLAASSPTRLCSAAWQAQTYCNKPSNSTGFLTEYHLAFLLRNAFSGKGGEGQRDYQGCRGRHRYKERLSFRWGKNPSKAKSLFILQRI